MWVVGEACGQWRQQALGLHAGVGRRGQVQGCQLHTVLSFWPSPRCLPCSLSSRISSFLPAADDEIADRELEQRARTLGTSTSGTSTTYPASPALLLHRRYFFPVLGAYVVGLLMAFAANAITHQGQPALIYLVPCTLGAVAAVAASRGELPRVLRFTDTTGEPASGEQQQEQQQ